jgi:hypothetical protein
VAVRGLASLFFFALLAIPCAVSAEAAAAPADARIDGVRIADQADGSVVSITLRGRMRPRLLRSVERLVSIVIADVDADGDLDILASTIREGLLLWRNAGRGHFVLARLPKARDALAGVPRVSRGTRESAHDEPGEGSTDSAPADIESGSDPLVLRSFVLFESFSPLAQYRVAPTGRAPPSLD